MPSAVKVCRIQILKVEKFAVDRLVAWYTFRVRARSQQMKKTLFIYASIAFLMNAVLVLPVSASTTDGIIDTTYKYAWGENIGWVNFGTNNGAVHVTDSVLSGYALSETVGWIYLGDVANNGEGALSGYAWGENVGWIKFNPTNGGVSINSSGEFSGSALGENIGWLIFDCSTSACVKTDWRPQSVRATPTPASGGGGVVLIWPSATPVPTPSPTPQAPLVPEIIKKITKAIPKITDAIAKFFAPSPTPQEIPVEEIVGKDAPLALRGQWELLNQRSIAGFALAPLPSDVALLAKKFPTLGATFKQVGITKITDVEKLRSVALSLPGMTQSAGLSGAGVPIARLTSEEKTRIPSDIVFAKTGGEFVDFNTALSVNDKGEPMQRVETIVGRPLFLAVKPEAGATRVHGYIVFTSKLAAIDYQNKLAGVESVPAFVANMYQIALGVDSNDISSLDTVENRLILQEFEYADPDGDGIFTATISAPVVSGAYEVITVMDYLVNGRIVSKEMRMTTVVDPEGYIFEKNGNKETRIPDAVVSIYKSTVDPMKYDLWPAKDFQQENPQITTVAGTYSFLVPPGSYYISVTAPGYSDYQGKPFDVKEGPGIHFNIELKPKGWWRDIGDWKSLLSVAVLLLLFYNFYRDKMREKFTGSRRT